MRRGSWPLRLRPLCHRAEELAELRANWPSVCGQLSLVTCCQGELRGSLADRRRLGSRWCLAAGWTSPAYGNSWTSQKVGPSVASVMFRRTRRAVTGSNLALSFAPRVCPR